jgi:DNA polymerase-3 subunit delta'
MQRWTYDLLSAKSASCVRYNPDFEKPLNLLATRLRAVDIARFHRTLVRQQRSVHHPLNARLYIEQLLFSYTALLRGEDATDSYAR